MTDQPSQDQTTETNQTKDEPQEAVVSKKDFDSVIEQLKQYKVRAETLENETKTKQIEAMKANQEWQKLAEINENKAREVEEKLNSFKSLVVKDKKLSAIREEAIKLGIRKEALNDLTMLDYPEVKLDTDNEGNFLVGGVDKAIQRLKATRPYWFQQSVTNVNPSTPSVNGSKEVSYDDLKKLKSDWEKTKSKEAEEKYKSALLKFKQA